ncbi:MAG: hypothetical protein JXJ19_10160 [Elusimicrobia bacterium]|nr:hypothetical protein [Elusimicrobiota bacterium]
MKKLSQLFLAFIFAAVLSAYSADTSDDYLKLIDMSLEELLNIQTIGTQGITMYGYMSVNVEKVFDELSINDEGKTVKTDCPHEWSTPHFNLFLKTPLAKNVETFVNIGDEDVVLKNMWGNIELAKEFQLRLGKMYRKFDLFNEKLDEVPTYLGIEPPELFDNDHLLLPRYTMFMVHGEKGIGGKSTLFYSMSTDNGEGGPLENVVPLGMDARVNLNDQIVTGFSSYFSSIGSGEIVSPKGVGEGSPDGGIMPWMKNDRYQVYGGFVETQLHDFVIKTAFWYADHSAHRDPASVLAVVNGTDLHEKQRKNFLGSSASKANADLTEADVVVKTNYRVETGYVRLGYYFHTDAGIIAPFAFLDWMKHPEAIASKTWGGDNECGVADNGIFYKPTIGVMYKPIEKLAIKLDASQHMQKFNGKDETYPETRLDVSYLFN